MGLRGTPAIPPRRSTTLVQPAWIPEARLHRVEEVAGDLLWRELMIVGTMVGITTTTAPVALDAGGEWLGALALGKPVGRLRCLTITRDHSPTTAVCPVASLTPELLVPPETVITPPSPVIPAPRARTEASASRQEAAPPALHSSYGQRTTAAVGGGRQATPTARARQDPG